MEKLAPKYETEVAQDEQELELFIELLRQEQITSYLEIGARYGGSLWKIARSMPIGSRIVAVDMPDGWGGRADGKRVLKACAGELRNLGYNVHLFIGDSKDAKIISCVKQFAPYDCVFIDGDHRIESVTSDWENYGAMSRIVAFHDISYFRVDEEKRKPVHVPELWEKLKQSHRHKEFKYHLTGYDNGIGVLWR